MARESQAIELKSPAEIAVMREGGRVLARILKTLAAAVEPGITTRQLEDLARQLMTNAGTTPAFLGYHNYPCVLCTSVNEQVVHGIPSKRALKSGDIVSIDCGIRHKGFFLDSAITVPVGKVAGDVHALLDATQEALREAIAVCKPGNRVGDIGHAVENVVLPRGLGIVRDYTGHGVGRSLHEAPKIPNYGEPGTGTRLQPGMTIAIEPMINLGEEDTRVLRDDWTVVTIDGKYSAHFEHTIAITDKGCEILTLE